jgi:hypothetical protein
MSIATMDGVGLRVWRDGNAVVIEGVGVHVNDAGELSNLLRTAAAVRHGQVERTTLVGTVGQLHVVRHPYCCGLKEGPDWRGHSGWTMQTEGAEALAIAVLQAAGLADRAQVVGHDPHQSLPDDVDLAELRRAV